MMRSLYSGVAGLKTHQTRMDVIGHNIANVNTTAFKASSMVFSELMSQTTQRASGANATTGTGGVNARQIGLGVKGGAININIAGQGSSQSTGNPFDVMITGDNFFIVNNGQENMFTRDGSFYVDGAGNLAMTSTGYNVMGWGVDPETGAIQQDSVAALRIMSAANMEYPPEATSFAYMSGILDKNDTDVTSANGKVVNLNFFDARGYEYTARITFRQSADPDQYSMELTKLLDSEGNEVQIPEDAGDGTAPITDISQILGGEISQQVNTTIKLRTGYKWNGNTMVDPSGATVADLTNIFRNGKLWTEADGATKVQAEQALKELDAIAAAYGYEGSTEEFLKYQVDVYNGKNLENTWSIQEMLSGQARAGKTGTPPKMSTLGTNTDGFMASGVAGADGSEIASTSRLFNGQVVEFDKNNGKLLTGGASTLNSDMTTTLNMSYLGGYFSDIELDLSAISSVGNKGTSTLGATSGASGLGEEKAGFGSGRRVGDMIGVSIQNNGMIYASYDNGQTKLLGQIATAAFANSSGLEKNGDNLYSATLNSGEFDGIGVDITAGGGYMSTGQLEMSNVDLSAEFTEMITTQRGFQANSRIITVSDTLLEELTNLKR